MASVILVGNLGNEFDLGNIEGGKIHLLTDGSIVRDPGTGELSVDVSALGITNILSLAGTVLTSTVNGQAADQDLAAAIEAGETVTVLDYDPATTTLTYTDEDGNDTTVDLSALTTDIYITGGSFDAGSMQLTLTDPDAGTPDVVIDLSTLLLVVTDNGDGTYELAQGGNTSTIDTRDGVSADAGNLLGLGADQKALLVEADVAALATEELTDAFGVHIGFIFP